MGRANGPRNSVYVTCIRVSKPTPYAVAIPIASLQSVTYIKDRIGERGVPLSGMLSWIKIDQYGMKRKVIAQSSNQYASIIAYLTWYGIFKTVITSRVSGRGNIFGSVCLSVCLSVCALYAEPLDL